jgi:hypothetical protein
LHKKGGCLGHLLRQNKYPIRARQPAHDSVDLRRRSLEIHCSGSVCIRRVRRNYRYEAVTGRRARIPRSTGHCDLIADRNEYLCLRENCVWYARWPNRHSTS